MKPLPAWQLAAAAILLSLGLVAFVKRPFAETSGPSFHYARLHAAMGASQTRHSSLEALRAEFEKALSLDPAYADAANQLANAYLNHGRMDDATAACRRTLEIDPAHPDAHNNLGLLLMLSGKSEEALAEFRAAIQSRPGFADASSNLGYTLMRLGRLQDGEAELRRAIESGAGINARHNLALCLMAQGRKKEASDQYAENLRTSPAHHASLNDLAWLLATAKESELRDGQKALELARQADALSGGKDPLVRHTVAAALAENGQFDDAALTARQASELATAAGNPSLASMIQKQAETYSRRQPWRE